MTFKPMSVGSSTSLLKITHNGSNTSPLTIALSGTGEDFSAPLATPISNTITSGGVATYNISTSPVRGNFNESIAFTCATPLPVGVTCTFLPARIVPGADAGQTVLTVSTVKSSTTAARSVSPHLWVMGVSAIFGIIVLSPTRRRRLGRSVLLTAGTILLLIASSCGGSSATSVKSGAISNSGTQPGTYQITVIGNAGGLTHSSQITLTVQ